jgi:hypothetical protein
LRHRKQQNQISFGHTYQMARRVRSESQHGLVLCCSFRTSDQLDYAPVGPTGLDLQPCAASDQEYADAVSFHGLSKRKRPGAN